MVLSFSEFIGTNVGLILLTAILSTLLPSPTDPLFFAIENWLYKNKKGRAFFEFMQIFLWYLSDSLWFLLLFVLAWILNISNVSVINTLTIILTISGIGTVVGIILTFIFARKRIRKR